MADAIKSTGSGWFRRTLVQIQVGGLLGLVVWSLVGSSILTWWYNKTAVGQVVSCAPAVQSALNDFVLYQLISVGVGVALVMVAGGLTRRKPAKAVTPGVAVR